ncbi:MAG: hypothetical protein O9262_07125, partial [Cyclobacteriaceae bacterium]|nr:hypothetical protein [Cyclobacteriaceae bacterium]
MRLHPSNTLVGTSVAGHGGIILLPTDVLLLDTDFNVQASNGVCAPDVLAEVVTVIIGVGTIDNTLVTSSTSATICAGGTTFVQVLNSEVGVSYQLRNNADDSPVNAAVVGTGTTINLPTGNLSNTTTFNVLAGSGTCSIELTDTETITVNPLPMATLAVTSSTPTTCVGSNVNITITSAENGVLYELRNDATNVVIASATGTGANLTIATGVLNTTTTFNILASNGTCSIELNTLITVTVNGGPDVTRSLSAFPSLICAGASSAIVVDSEIGIVYQLRLNVGNVNVGGAFLGNGFSINLPTSDIAANTTFNVLARNQDGSCAVQLNQTVTITTRATNDPLCGSNNGGNGNENCTLFTTNISETKPGCNGDDDGQLSFNIAGGTPSPNYTVILIDTVIVAGLPVANQTSETGPAGSAIVISGLKPAQYYYRILDGSGNICTLPYKLDRQS